MIDMERFRKIDEIFRRAVHAPPATRDTLVASLAAGDASLASDVLSLLREDEAASGLLDGGSPANAFESHSHEEMPERIGSYLVLSMLGRGGMGVVYEARQEMPLRHVAIKVINPTLFTRQSLRRYEHEARVLGRLEHPSIARIYEAGLHAAGGVSRPYLVMELVRGAPLDEHARRAGLAVRARLELLARVCDGVHHAHQRGIIHRDLKPANILVDESGEPRILDFGVARVIDDAPIATARTEAGQIVGTLSYMSPEQATGTGGVADTRSDVYSLGVIAYELLTGHLPYRITGLSIPEALRTVCEQSPERPRAHAPALDPDIETIVLKALDKEPARRYDSAAALATDIRRVLAYQPIAARPPSAMYLLSRFARRNPPLMWTIATACGMLIAAAGLVVRFAVGQAHARETAQQHAQIANAVSEFLNDDVLGAADPHRAKGTQPTVLEAIAMAEGRVGDRFASSPLTEAGVRMALGMVRLNTGGLPQAQDHFTRALELRTAVLGLDSEPSLEATEMLARTLFRRAHYEESMAMRRDALARAEQTIGLDHPLAISLAGGLADTLSFVQRHQEAMLLQRAALERARRTYGAQHEEVIISTHNLGAVLYNSGAFEEAYELQRALFADARRLLGENHPTTSTVLANLAVREWRLGKDLDAALQTARDALDLRIRVMGPMHDHTLTSRMVLARTLQSVGRFEESEREYRDCLESQRLVLRPEHPKLLWTQMYLAMLLIEQGRIDEADAIITPVRAVIDDVAPYDPGKRGHIRAVVGFVRQAQGRDEEACAELRLAVELLALAPSEPDSIRLRAEHASTHCPD